MLAECTGQDQIWGIGINLHNPLWKDRDRFIAGKEHARLAEYPARAEMGFYPADVLNSYEQNDGLLVGHNSMIETPNYQIFSEVVLQGSWRNEFIFPEWYGAIGNGINDDRNAIRQAIRSAFNTHKELKLVSPYYYVSGNNPFGLEYFKEEKDIVYFYKEGVKGDDNRGRYNLSIDGNGALIFWEPRREDDVFAFVGYLRNSVIQNINIYCKQKGTNHWGDIFSTTFGKNGQSHIFSCNIFRNIQVNGGCRRIFSFDSKTTEKQTHDDLSIFEKISASGYKVFCYISNGNSVSNTFRNCSTCLNVDGAVDYYINCPSWAGNLRIVGQHFTIMDCKDAVLIKDDTKIIRDRIVYVDMPRLEVLSTAKRWKYFDLCGLTLYMNGVETITNPGYDENAEYGIVRTRNAQVTISDVKGLFQPFSLFSISEQSYRPAYVFDNCSFRVGSNIEDVQEFPYIVYHGRNVVYNDTPSAAISTELFPYYRVLHSMVGDSKRSKGVSSWNLDYEMGRLSVTPSFSMQFTSSEIIGGRRMSIVNAKSGYYVPCDIVATSLKYYCDNYKTLEKVRIKISGNTERTILLNKVNERDVTFFQNEKPFVITAGSVITFSFTGNNGKTSNETSLNINESYFDICFHTPFLSSEYKLLKEEYDN